MLCVVYLCIFLFLSKNAVALFVVIFTEEEEMQQFES